MFTIIVAKKVAVVVVKVALAILVSAFLSERFSHTTTTADIEGVFVWNVGTTTYVYNMDTLNTANTTIDAAEISLVGTITQGAALVTGNIVYA